MENAFNLKKMINKVDFVSIFDQCNQYHNRVVCFIKAVIKPHEKMNFSCGFLFKYIKFFLVQVIICIMIKSS
jgi:hypothetical protein